MKLAKFALISMLAVVVASCGSSTANNENDDHSDAENAVVAEAATYALNTESSSVAWKGDVIGIYFHTGTANFSSGSLSTENGAITGGEFEVDLVNLSTTDSNYKEEGDRAKLVGHLQSDEFFNTAEFPKANFKITSVDNGVIKGDLTIRGITHEETVENVAIEEKDGNINATGKLVFARRKYDVKWEHYLKDHTLANEIVLDLNISGSKS